MKNRMEQEKNTRKDSRGHDKYLKLTDINQKVYIP